MKSKSKHKNYFSMSVEADTQFEAELRKLFRKIRPTKIIETGTYLGQGTTAIIWRALQDLKINADFTTIEVNPFYYHQAILYFEHNRMQIKAELGLSIPRLILPNKEQIADKFVSNKEYEGIYYDFNEHERAELYFRETNFPVPDNLLYDAVYQYEFTPDFVLLDSSGHIGFIEFEYLINLIRGDCYLMLDDIYHCKHYKSLQKIKSDPHFEIIVESPEKYGFCIAKFTYHSFKDD